MQPSAILSVVFHDPILQVARPHALVGSWRDCLRQECTSADARQARILEMMERSVELPVSLPGLRAVRGTTDVAAYGGEGALRRRAHRARRYRVVGRRQGLALRARLHPGEAARRRRSPSRPPRTDDVHGRHAADAPTSLGSRAKAGRWRSRSSKSATNAPRRFTASSMPRAQASTASRSRSLSPKLLVRSRSSAARILTTRVPSDARWSTSASGSATRSRSTDLAAYADLDKFHLCRAFRAQIGMPPHTYLTHLRIARAKELLHRGVRASDVAPLVGFYDQAQLTRHFRRLVGTTPARYGKCSRAHGAGH